MFYANIQIVKMGVELSLECQVKYMKFTLNKTVLDRILGLPPVVQPHLSRLVLKHDPRLLYYVIVHTVLPKSNFIDCVNAKTLEVIYLLMSGKSINFCRYILKYMPKVSSVSRPTPLPYANVLTLIFQHFGVCLENEIRETRPVPVINPHLLTLIKFLPTKLSAWKFLDEITLAKQALLPKNWLSSASSPFGIPQIRFAPLCL